MPDATVDGIFAELQRDVPRAMEQAAAGVQPEFPANLLDSITCGIRKRMRLF